MVFIDTRIGLAVLRDFLRYLVGRNHRNSGMVHHATVPWHDLSGLYPFVLGEVSRNINVFVVILTATANRKLGNREHYIRFDMPAYGELRSRRQILGVALLGAGSHPGIDGSDVFAAEPRIIEELADLRIGVPGRHLALHHCFTNRTRP